MKNIGHDHGNISYNGLASVAVQSQISSAHFCNIERIKYLKFETSTTSHCEHFVLNFERNCEKVGSWCKFYELLFEVLEMCFLHCSISHNCVTVGNLAGSNDEHFLRYHTRVHCIYYDRSRDLMKPTAQKVFLFWNALRVNTPK